MKKILLPTDFSNNAKNAIDYAITLFKNQSCTFYVLHAFYAAPSATGTKFEAEDNLSRLLKELKDKNENQHHNFKAVLEVDSPLSAINVTAINKNVGLIVMGTKGASGIRTVFLGSNTAYVIKHIANFPVLAVPETYENHLPQEILFANDFKREIRDKELEPLISIAKLWDSELKIVHIEKEKELTREQKVNKALLRDSFKSIRYSFMDEIKGSSVSETVKKLEKEYKSIGIVAMF